MKRALSSMPIKVLRYQKTPDTLAYQELAVLIFYQRNNIDVTQLVTAV